ncbi:ABC transporter permease [Candidatus Amarolinea aalborgensis]|uniref:ABC transporter permease n=1 Tax=Candidatus Amarolinea aalborgensis TaxID=2249329 RepID=UPI003BFA26DB
MTGPASVTRMSLHTRGNWFGRLLEPSLSLNAWLMYLFMYAPIVILILFSFNASRYASSWEGFSLRWYQVLFNDRAIGLALRNSLLVALLATAISTVIGTMAALALERYDFWGKLSFDALLYLPIIIPEIAMAVMLLLFFILTRVQLGLGTVIIAHVAFCVSYVAVVVRARVAGLDRTLEEAAQDLYANEWQTFRRVTLPLIMPGIVGGALLAFTLSLDDFVITFFTTGPGTTTLPIQVYGMIKTGVTPEINALSALMLVVSVVLVVASLVLQRRT